MISFIRPSVRLTESNLSASKTSRSRARKTGGVSFPRSSTILNTADAPEPTRRWRTSSSPTQISLFGWTVSLRLLNQLAKLLRRTASTSSSRTVILPGPASTRRQRRSSRGRRTIRTLSADRSRDTASTASRRNSASRKPARSSGGTARKPSTSTRAGGARSTRGRAGTRSVSTRSGGS